MSGTTGPRGIIGTQRWMTRNLDVDTYRNGDSIPEVQDQATWDGLTTGAWCYYDNDPANGAIYGKLYNWYAVNDPRGLAPLGWHVPTETEFNTLRTFLGGSSAGGSLKAIGTDYWISPNTGATNRSGFNAFGGGYRVNVFVGTIGANGRFWASTSSGGFGSALWIFDNSTTIAVTSTSSGKFQGLSVRVIKD